MAEEEFGEREALLAVRAVLRAATKRAEGQRYLRSRVGTLDDAARLSIGLINAAVEPAPAQKAQP